MKEIFCAESFTTLELLIEFVNNHRINVINIFPSTYYKVGICGDKIECRDYKLIYSYREE